MTTKPFIRETSQLFSLDLNDYDESIRVMIEFIAHRPIVVPLTKIPDPPIPFSLLHTTFEPIKIHNGTLETKITRDRIVPIHKSTFLKAIGVAENPEDFIIQESMTEDFQSFLNHIRYHGEYKAKIFKKSAVLGLWTVLMHFIVQGLSGKHGGTDSLSKDSLYVVYNIYSGKTNVVDHTEVLWQDFRKFAINHKPH